MVTINNILLVHHWTKSERNCLIQLDQRKIFSWEPEARVTRMMIMMSPKKTDWVLRSWKQNILRKHLTHLTHMNHLTYSFLDFPNIKTYWTNSWASLLIFWTKIINIKEMCRACRGIRTFAWRSNQVLTRSWILGRFRYWWGQFGRWEDWGGEGVIL